MKTLKTLAVAAALAATLVPVIAPVLMATSAS
jgi:hypothetical protein